MKRRDLIKHPESNGYYQRREGADHTVYSNPANGNTTAVPRQREVKKYLCKKICKELEIEPPF